MVCMLNAGKKKVGDCEGQSRLLGQGGVPGSVLQFSWSPAFSCVTDDPEHQIGIFKGSSESQPKELHWARKTFSESFSDPGISLRFPIIEKKW